MNKTTRVAAITLLISFVVLALKTKAFYATHSLGVMSDALETVVNVITAFVALFAVRIATAPADEDHPYGHGKLEYFSAAFEGGLIFFAALAIIFEAVKSFFIPNEKLHVFNGNIYLFSATAINLITGLYLINYGNKQNSEALKASGKHILSDVVTTGAIFAGLILVKVTDVLWIDSLVAVIAGFYLLYGAYKILRNTSGALMDETDTESVEQLAELFNRHQNEIVIDIHHVKLIRSGGFHHIDAHMVVPEYLNVAKVHELADVFETAVVKDYRYDGEVAFHIDPCKRKFCKQCKMQDCSIRAAAFEKSRTYNKTDLIKGPQYTN